MDSVRIGYGVPQSTAGSGNKLPASATPAPAPAPAPVTVQSAETSAPPPAERNLAAAKKVAENTQRTREDLQQLLEAVSSFIDPERRSLAFEVHDELGRTIVSVYDAETEELIRQIPDETLVRLALAMQEYAQQGGDAPRAAGFLLQEQA